MLDAIPGPDAGRRFAADTPLDRAALQQWIQPRHLEPAAIDSYRQAFASHPARLVTIDDFLQEDAADRLSRFLAAEAEFQPEYGLYSTEVAVPKERWDAASPDDRFFRMRKLKGTPPAFKTSRNAFTYVMFRQAFQRAAFMGFFEAVSALPLGSSDDFGSHSMVQGDFLRPHSDDNRNRQLAIVIYLSPDWDDRMGGALHVVDSGGREWIVRPRFNGVVAFDVLTDSTHFVAPITAEAGTQARLTIGGWYHRVEQA